MNPEQHLNEGVILKSYEGVFYRGVLNGITDTKLEVNVDGKVRLLDRKHTKWYREVSLYDERHVLDTQKKILVYYKSEKGKHNTIEGDVMSYTNEFLSLKMRNGELIEIPYERIAEAHYEFGTMEYDNEIGAVVLLACFFGIIYMLTELSEIGSINGI